MEVRIGFPLTSPDGHLRWSRKIGQVLKLSSPIPTAGAAKRFTVLQKNTKYFRCGVSELDFAIDRPTRTIWAKPNASLTSLLSCLPHG
jgi:hypothetical protein